MKEYPIATFKNIVEDVKNYTMTFQIEEVSDGRCKILSELYWNSKKGTSVMIDKFFVPYFPIQEQGERLEKVREIFNLVIQAEEKKKEVKA